MNDIQAGRMYMSRVEAQIADVILQEPQRILSSTLSELATYCKVSQGSIINFAKKFSPGGYSALKLAVSGCCSRPVQAPFLTTTSDVSMHSIMDSRIDEITASFRNTASINPEENLRKAAELILKAKRVELYGVFLSGLSASHLCLQLIQLGIPATYVSDSLSSLVSASILDPDGLVIAVSSSGQTREVVDPVRIARRNHTPVICITTNRFSPLAEISDVVLQTSASCASTGERQSEIQLSQLLIAGTLCSHLRSIIDAGGQTHYYRLLEILQSHSIQNQEVPSWPD